MVLLNRQAYANQETPIPVHGILPALTFQAPKFRNLRSKSPNPAVKYFISPFFCNKSPKTGNIPYKQGFLICLENGGLKNDGYKLFGLRQSGFQASAILSLLRRGDRHRGQTDSTDLRWSKRPLPDHWDHGVRDSPSRYHRLQCRHRPEITRFNREWTRINANGRFLGREKKEWGSLYLVPWYRTLGKSQTRRPYERDPP